MSKTATESTKRSTKRRERIETIRTAAAELLGLSRQSLYMKLGRYGFDEDLSSAGPKGGRSEGD